VTYNRIQPFAVQLAASYSTALWHRCSAWIQPSGGRAVVPARPGHGRHVGSRRGRARRRGHRCGTSRDGLAGGLRTGPGCVPRPSLGRAYEPWSEEPALAGQLGAAFVSGLQGAGTTQDIDTNPLRVAATIKHFVGNSESINGHDRAEGQFSIRYLQDLFLPAYRDAIEAGAKMAMVSSSSVNGVPATGCNFCTARRSGSALGSRASRYGPLLAAPRSVSAGQFGIAWERYQLIGVAALAATAGIAAGVYRRPIGLAAGVCLAVLLVGAALTHLRARARVRATVTARRRPGPAARRAGPA
jgi:Glycosyl hydrolase family 3 N terminal domain